MITFINFYSKKIKKILKILIKVMKLRIIAGKHKGRRLKTLEGLNTRPMMDRMKESVFNILGPYFEGQIVLDLFGGSASLSLEALSRGCKMSYIVEMSRDAVKVINENVSSLHEVENVKIFNVDYKVALKKFASDNIKFDLIFLDPPYRLKIIDEIIKFLIDNNMISDNGNIICQYLKNNYQAQSIENDNNKLDIVKNYSYANSEVVIYEYIKVK